jgi:hypothetical protein
LYASWVAIPSSQRLDQIFLNGISVWNTSDPDAPSDIPTEGNWSGNVTDRTIPNGAVANLVIRFGDALQPTGYQIHLVFDIGCQVIGAQ